MSPADGHAVPAIGTPAYSRHPLSAAFPDMAPDDLAALVTDVRAHGLLDPVVLLDGQVIDGWHRYTACRAAGVAPRFESLDAADPAAWVLSKNLARRHLDAGQRAVAVAMVRDWQGTGRPAGEKGDSVSSFSNTNATMAREAGTDVRTIQRAKAAVGAGLGEAVRDGKVSVARAAAIARLPEADRAAALARPVERLIRNQSVAGSVPPIATEPGGTSLDEGLEPDGDSILPTATETHGVGRVAAAVLKTDGGQFAVGSNPTLSVEAGSSPGDGIEPPTTVRSSNFGTRIELPTRTIATDDPTDAGDDTFDPVAECEHLHGEVERLERLLAAEGDERAAALVADNKRLVALNRTLESRLHGLMEEARAATHDARYWKGRFDRLDRAQRKGA